MRNGIRDLDLSVMCAHCSWGDFTFLALLLGRTRKICLHIHIHLNIHPNIHAHINKCIHTYAYFRNHGFTVTPPILIHFHSVLCCLLHILYFHVFSCTARTLAPNKIISFIHVLNFIIHMKEFALLAPYHRVNTFLKKNLNLFANLPFSQLCQRLRIYSQIPHS